ncbi:MAG: T9SS C-terminal target domain-containing protein [Candidatus Zixiibacteriota bacterium]|nr:MAG: T9SS C-terminal target domain-containing protein [candidate division Zixibacteria bacterium]
MRLVFSIVLLALAFSSAHADTIIPPGNVSGFWSLAGSPYLVRGEVLVAPGDTLTIEPGVQVRFTGMYKFRVQGRLVAGGTEQDSIYFRRHHPGQAWRGLRFEYADTTSKLEYCCIEGVRAAGLYFEAWGGGVYIEGRMNVRHCTITDNYAHVPQAFGTGGGVCFYEGSYGLVEYCHIVRNWADSGGAIITGIWCQVTIRYNCIENNIGGIETGGIYIGGGTRCIIHDNIISNNRDLYGWDGGGGITLWGPWTCEVYNNLIINNGTYGVGGGVFLRYWHSNYDLPRIYNNTIVGNRAREGGGGIYILRMYYETASPLIFNNVIWGNQSPQGAQIMGGGGSPAPWNITYNAVQGGWPGLGNIAADPLFTAGPGGDFYLSQWEAGQPQQSPCVDGGDPASWLLPGTTRTDGLPDLGVVDMGYHYPVQGELAAAREANNPVLAPAALSLACSPNPFNPQTVARFEMRDAGHVLLKVYNTAGREVATLMDGWREAGSQEVMFDGSGLPSGIYFARLEANEHIQTLKLALVK